MRRSCRLPGTRDGKLLAGLVFAAKEGLAAREQASLKALTGS